MNKEMDIGVTFSFDYLSCPLQHRSREFEGYQITFFFPVFSKAETIAHQNAKTDKIKQNLLLTDFCIVLSTSVNWPLLFKF